MGSNFLHYNLCKTYGKTYANETRNFKYALLRFYNIPYQLRNQARHFTLNHIMMLINTFHTEKVFTTGNSKESQ